MKSYCELRWDSQYKNFKNQIMLHSTNWKSEFKEKINYNFWILNISLLIYFVIDNGDYHVSNKYINSISHICEEQYL